MGCTLPAVLGRDIETGGAMLAPLCRVAAAEAAARADHDASQRLRAELRGTREERDHMQRVCFRPAGLCVSCTARPALFLVLY